MTVDQKLLSKHEAAAAKRRAQAQASKEQRRKRRYVKSHVRLADFLNDIERTVGASMRQATRSYARGYAQTARTAMPRWDRIRYESDFYKKAVIHVKALQRRHQGWCFTILTYVYDDGMYETSCFWGIEATHK